MPEREGAGRTSRRGGRLQACGAASTPPAAARQLGSSAAGGRRQRRHLQGIRRADRPLVREGALLLLRHVRGQRRKSGRDLQAASRAGLIGAADARAKPAGAATTAPPPLRRRRRTSSRSASQLNLRSTMMIASTCA